MYAKTRFYVVWLACNILHTFVAYGADVYGHFGAWHLIDANKYDSMIVSK
jgi:hypothetical protein